MTIDDKISMAREMLWNAANDSEVTIGSIAETHQWLMALEAAKSCAPVNVSAVIG